MNEDQYIDRIIALEKRVIELEGLLEESEKLKTYFVRSAMRLARNLDFEMYCRPVRPAPSYYVERGGIPIDKNAGHS